MNHEKSNPMKKHNKNKKDENKGSLLSPVRSLLGNAMKSGQLFKAEAGLIDADPDILVEYDSYLLVPKIP